MENRPEWGKIKHADDNGVCMMNASRIDFAYHSSKGDDDASHASTSYATLSLCSLSRSVTTAHRSACVCCRNRKDRRKWGVSVKQAVSAVMGYQTENVHTYGPFHLTGNTSCVAESEETIPHRVVSGKPSFGGTWRYHISVAESCPRQVFPTRHANRKYSSVLSVPILSFCADFFE